MMMDPRPKSISMPYRQTAMNSRMLALLSALFFVVFYGMSSHRAVQKIWNTSFTSSAFAPQKVRTATSLHTDIDIEEESFSACLLIMDDNFRLPEWINFHYFVLPLRYLVVAVDPNSKTSPSRMLDRWRDRIKIVEWTDANFTSEDLMIQPTDSSVQKHGKYIRRQVGFYQACSRHLMEQNRTWTTYHDTDEFLLVTKQANVSQHLLRQPGSVLKILQHYSRHTNTGHRHWERYFSSSSCVIIPRVLFGAVNSSEEEVHQGVPSFIDARQFDTLNFRHPAPHPGHRGGKSIMDMSRIPVGLEFDTPGPHRIIESLCRNAFAELPYELPLAIHHYLGSWEAFSFRDSVFKDTHKTFEQWQEMALMQSGTANDDARPWLSGFVTMVGETAAKELLRDAGLPRDYRKQKNETATN